MNGLEVLTQLSLEEKGRLVPVVIFSSTIAEPELTECYRMGANSCVTKPSCPHEYMERLAEVTHYWLTINQFWTSHRATLQRPIQMAV